MGNGCRNSTVSSCFAFAFGNLLGNSNFNNNNEFINNNSNFILRSSIYAQINYHDVQFKIL